MKRGVIHWDVDTQHVFTHPQGTLYAKGAELIKPRLAQPTAYARGKGIPIVVKYAIDGMIDLGIPTILLVLDSTAAIVTDAVQPLVKGGHREGVRVVASDQIVCGSIV